MPADRAKPNQHKPIREFITWFFSMELCSSSRTDHSLFFTSQIEQTSCMASIQYSVDVLVILYLVSDPFWMHQTSFLLWWSRHSICGPYGNSAAASRNYWVVAEDNGAGAQAIYQLKEIAPRRVISFEMEYRKESATAKLEAIKACSCQLILLFHLWNFFFFLLAAI